MRSFLPSPRFALETQTWRSKHGRLKCMVDLAEDAICQSPGKGVKWFLSWFHALDRVAPAPSLFGYLWAMDLKDFRTAEEKAQDGQPEHATMNETSWILALRPELVSPDCKTAKPRAGKTIEE